MKTTTIFLTLLIAVAMITSSSVTASTTKTNVIIDDGQTEPLSVGESELNAPADFELMQVLDKEVEYSGSNRGVVLYDNGMSYSNGLSAQEDPISGLDSRVADDFILSDDSDVGDVHWVCVYWNPGPPSTFFDWGIEFFEDDGTGNRPGASIDDFIIPESAVSTVDLGGGYYECSANLPSVVSLNGATKYWIMIYGIGAFTPQSGVGGHLGIIGHQGLFKGSIFGYPDWVDSNVVFGSAYDLAFQLTGLPLNDVYADTIIAPNDLSAFCPCTPVEVTVSNVGLNDQVDVPVSVEIRRYLMMDSFEDPFGLFWDPIYAGNMWMQSSWEMVYPFATGARTGPFMAELDSGMTGPGQAYLDSLAIDISGACHPMMSFYMWHDEYGSDDFINVFANDGTGWTQVGGPFYRLCCPDCPIGWREHVIDLSAFSGGSIWIRFEGNCDPVPTAYELMIDDFAIYDQEYYFEKEVDVNSGETVNVEFPEWCPCHWQDPAWMNTYFTVDIIACTSLATDEVPGNDCVADTATVHLPFMHDIQALSIDEPVGRIPVQTFDMCGTIKNVGQYQECCFSVYMRVYREDPAASGPGYPILFEDFEGAFPPAGWTVVDEGNIVNSWRRNDQWGTIRTNYAGSGYCADSDSDRAGSGHGTLKGSLIPPSFSLATAKGAFLEFDAAYNWIGGAEYFDVDVSTDGGSNWDNLLHWTSDHSPYGPGEHVILDLSAYAYQSDVTVRFHYDDTGVWAWWMEVDNVDLYVTETIGFETIPEYEDQFCVDEIDVCEEMQICFADWTPAQPWPDCGEVVYMIEMETRLCDPPDQNAANNFVYEYLTVEFWHDVAVKDFTSPAYAGRGIIFDQQPIPDDSTGHGPFSDAGSGGPYRCYENFWGLTEDITGIHYWGLCGYGSGVPQTGDTHQISFAVDSGGVPGAHTDDFDGTLGTEISFVGTGVYYWGYELFYFEWDPLPAAVSMTDGWISVYKTNVNSQIFAMIDALTGDGIAYQSPVGTLYYDLAFELVGGGGTPGVPTPDIYLPCGTQDICVNVENLGTFVETGCTVYWDMYEYYSDPPNPTYVDGGSVIVDLDPGQVEEVCLTTFDFTEPGIYYLVVEIVPPGVDCYLDNNIGDLALGIDCCPPESTHSLDPATPDGENNWYISDVEVTIEAVDEMCPDPCEVGVETGISEIIYTINGVEYSIPGASGSFILDQDGNNLVTYYAIDGVGNEEVAHTFTVAIDQTPPTCDLAHTEYETGTGWAVDFEAIAADVTSGMNRVEFKRGSELLDTVNAPPFEYTHTWESGDGSATFYAYAYDQAGNSASDSASIQLSLNLVLQQGKVVSVNKVQQKLI